MSVLPLPTAAGSKQKSEHRAIRPTTWPLVRDFSSERAVP
jgi:hypothetical protein